MTRQFAFLHDPPLPGSVNMAIDQKLFEQVEERDEDFTWIRFYSWIRPTISLGRNQRPAHPDSPPASTGVAQVVRPTGGRAVLHHDEITYAVVSSDRSLFPIGNVEKTYRVVTRVLQNGLHRLGIEATLQPGRERRPHRTAEDPGDPACFMSVSRSELVVDGRKLAGSAQRQGRRGFLQHGSLPLTVDFPFMSRTLNTPVEALRTAMVSLSHVSSRQISSRQVRFALQQAFLEFLTAA